MPPLIEIAITQRLGNFLLDIELASDTSPLVIIGPSGSGKTLTLRTIAGISRQERGRIAISGRTLFDSEHRINVAPQARRVGYVPQEYALFPNLTVEGNIGFGLRGSGATKLSRIDEMIELTGLQTQRRQRPRSLSGGQRQRVALARALAVRPDLLLLDEPFAALDTPTREALLDDVRRLVAATGTPTLFVTHDRNEAMKLADRLAVLMDGRIRQVGTPAEVFGSPADESVANFVGVETIAAGRVEAIDEGAALVSVGEHLIEGGADVNLGDEVLVCLRPEDVVLGPSRGAGVTTSARNHLPGPCQAHPRLRPVRAGRAGCGIPHRLPDYEAFAGGAGTHAGIRGGRDIQGNRRPPDSQDLESSKMTPGKVSL